MGPPLSLLAQGWPFQDRDLPKPEEQLAPGFFEAIKEGRGGSNAIDST